MEKGMTKNMSKYLYGLAILLMIYHHLFCIPERIQYEYFSLLDYIIPIFKEPLTAERRLAFFGKICVALLSFISGYGLSKSSNLDVEKNEIKFLVNSYLNIFKRYIKLVFKVLLVILLIIFPFRLINNQPITFKEFILNLFGIEYSYSGEWWYYNFYINLLIIFPILNLIFCNNFGSKRKEIIYKIISIVILGILIGFDIILLNLR